MMKKILFLPFLQLPSGHHQVADTLEELLLEIDPKIATEKIDVLDYGFGKLESVVSFIYLKWIQYFPAIYNFIYQRSVYTNKYRTNNYWTYELLFKKIVLKLVTEKNPSLIICTHALPSYMLSKLRQEKQINTTVVNVYTDFFIHKFWGIENIDYHLVSHEKMKEYLVGQGVKTEKIFLTGIPIHPKITKTAKKKRDNNDLLIGAIMGGSLGVGNILKLATKLMNSKKMKFFILCGKNKLLYEKIIKLNNANLVPLPYITCKQEIDKLYSTIDFAISKPGGVTVSECLMKDIPILIYHALPGQEEINLQELSELGLVYSFVDWKKISGDIDQQLYPSILKLLTSSQLSEKLEKYRIETDKNNVKHIFAKILADVFDKKIMEVNT